MTGLAVPGVAYARANWGRWVVDCPVPTCHDALSLPPGTAGMICQECGTASDIVWPVQTALIEELLKARPDVATRNWEPGEPVNHLLVENLAHGLTHAGTPELGAASSRLVLDAAGAGTPTLVLMEQEIVIDAHQPLTIGA